MRFARNEVELLGRKGEADKRIDEIKSTILTKEVFEAYRSSDVQRMERMEKMLEQLLQKK